MNSLDCTTIRKSNNYFLSVQFFNSTPTASPKTLSPLATPTRNLSGSLDAHLRNRAPVPFVLPLASLHGFLPLLTSPLIGDAFSLPSVLVAWTRMGLNQLSAQTPTALLGKSPSASSTPLCNASGDTGGTEAGQTTVLRFFYFMLASRPAGQVVSTMLLRSIATSPLQRWLRDEFSLLGEQYVAYLAVLEKQKKEYEFGIQTGDATGGAAADGDSPSAQFGPIHPNPNPNPNPPSAQFGPIHGQPALELGSADWARMVALCKDVAASLATPPGDGARSHVPKPTPSSPQSAMIPSFDEIVRHVLRPVWRDVYCSPYLDTAHAFAAIIAETLAALNEQVEKKSYGLHSTHLTIVAWDNLCRMLRVAQVVDSRRLVSKLTVEKLSSSCTGPGQRAPRMAANGSHGIFKALAEDTLSFSMGSEAALQHEQKCLEITSKKALSSTVAPTPSMGGETLQAWGTVSDRRWKDLLALMESDDLTITETAPIPILSPKAAHSPSSFLTISPLRSPLARANSFTESTKGTAAPKLRKRRPLLLLFPRHSGQIASLAAYRSWALADKFRKKISRTQCLGHAASHLFSLQPVMRAAVATTILQSTVLPILLQVSLFEEEPLSPIVLSQIRGADVSNMMDLFSGAHPDFIRGASELLLYLDVAVTNRNAMPEMSAVPGPFDDEVPKTVWPPVDDFFLEHQVNEFISRNDESVGPVPNSVRRKIKDYTALLLVQHLRFACNLRGIKASALFPSDLIRALLTDTSMLGVGLDGVDVQALAKLSAACCASEAGAPDAAGSADLLTTRMDFFEMCFARFGGESPMPIYRLAELMGFQIEAVRIIHADALCAKGDNDEEVSHLVSQISEFKGQIVDRITVRLRSRISTSILPLKFVPAFGQILAALNPVAWEWVQGSDVSQNASNHNIASTRQLVLSLLTICNREDKARADAWYGRRKKLEMLLELSLALLQCLRVGIL